jgi:hypothetical protein
MIIFIAFNVSFPHRTVRSNFLNVQPFFKGNGLQLGVITSNTGLMKAPLSYGSFRIICYVYSFRPFDILLLG